MRKSVLCVGVAVQDHIFRIDRMPTAATKIFASDYQQIGGGPAANAAATVARLGSRAELWARVGQDETGNGMIAELRNYGVETSMIRQIEGGRSSVSSVSVDDRGERLIVAYADTELDQDASWLPLGSLGRYDSVLCDVRWPEAAKHVLTAAQKLGVLTVLDADLTTTNAAEDLFPLASYAVFSEPALFRLAGTDNYSEALRLVARRTSGQVSVTLGGDGFAFLDKGGEVVLVPGFKVTAIDTLAAGDVFHGAFALAMAEGMAVADAGRFAGATAAIKCSRWGGRAGIPNRQDVEAILASNP